MNGSLRKGLSLLPAAQGRARAPVLSERAWGRLCAAPALVFLATFALAPVLAGIWLSLQRRLPIFGVIEFVGLRNYLLLFQDERFWAAGRTTLYFTIVSVGAELALGLGLALLLERALAGRSGDDSLRAGGGRQSWMRVMVLIPWAVPTVVSARLWGWLYQPEYGLLNYLLAASGLMHDPINWLSDPWWALHAAILMDVWKTTPFAALLLLAALKAIPAELYLAARVDGARGWASFRHITLPLLTPVLLIVLTFRTMDAFRVFDAVYVLTGGGPGNGTETLSIYAYKTLFQALRFGYGSALSTVTFLAILLITAGYLLLLQRQLRATA